MSASDRPRSSWLPDAPPAAPRTLDEALELAPEATLAVIGAQREVLAIEIRRAVERGLDVLVIGEGLAPADERDEKAFARAAGRLLLAGDAVIDGVPLAGGLPDVRRGGLGVVASDVGAAAEAIAVAERAGVGVSQVLVVGPGDLAEPVEGAGTFAAIARLGGDPDTRALFVVGPAEPRLARAVQHACVETSRPSVTCTFRGEPRRGLGWEVVATIAELPRSLARLDVGGWGVEEGGGARSASPTRHGRIVGVLSSPSLALEAIAPSLAAGLDVASDVPCPGVLPEDVGGHTIVAELEPARRALRVRALLQGEGPVAIVVLDLARTASGDGAAAPLVATLRESVEEARTTGRPPPSVFVARAAGAPLGPLDRELLDLGCRVVPTVGEATRCALSLVAQGEEGARPPLGGRPLSVLTVAADRVARHLAARGVPVVPIDWTAPAGGDARIARLVGLLR